MKLTLNLLTVFFFAITLSSCSTDTLDDDQNVAKSNDIVIPEAKTIEIEILELINQHRISIGLNELKSIDIIKGQAYSHTDYMIDIDEVNHDYFHNRKAYLQANADAQSVSENVAYGYSSANSVVNAWLNSEGHRQTIEGDFSHFEISAEKNANDKWYFTNIFIKK